MGKPFGKMMGLVNDQQKPLIKFLDERSSDYSDLYTAVLRENVARTEDIAAAMVDENRKVALIEFGLLPQIFFAFDCAPYMLEGAAGPFARMDKHTLYRFIDIAEEAGVPSDACSTDRGLIGMAIDGELPEENAFFVTCGTPCDGTRIAYPIMQQLLDCPALYIDPPYRGGREAVLYFAKQLKDQLIPFLEEQTGKKFDIDRLRTLIEESNRAWEYMIDIFDTLRLKPAPLPAGLRTAPYQLLIAGAGLPETTEAIKRILDEVTLRVKAGRIERFEEKHRVFWAHIQPTFDSTYQGWMEKEFGATVLPGSLPSSPISPTVHPFIDTTNLDTMLEGIAWQGLDLTMAVLRYDTLKFIDWTVHAYDYFHCDCMILSLHIGCKSMVGMTGLWRRILRKREIPALFIELDYNDERVTSTESIHEQIEEFFTTVME